MARVVIPAAGSISSTDKVLVRIGSEGIVREIPASALMGLVPEPDTGVLNDSYVPKTGTDAKSNRVITGIGKAVVGGSAGPRTDPVRILVDDFWISQKDWPAQSGPTKPFKYVSSSGYRLTDNLVDTAAIVEDAVTHGFVADTPDELLVEGTTRETMIDISYTPSSDGNLVVFAGTQVKLEWTDKSYPENTIAYWRLLMGTASEAWEKVALEYQTPPLTLTPGKWILTANASRVYSLVVSAGVSTRYRLQGRLSVAGRAQAKFTQNTLHGLLLKR